MKEMKLSKQLFYFYDVLFDEEEYVWRINM